MKKLFLISIILLGIANTMYSQTVSIDENFGENGTMAIPNIEFLDFDTQGNIFAFGDGFAPTILKTDANGDVDQNFGTDGMVILNEYASFSGKRYGIKITGDNKIVIVFDHVNCGFAGCDEPKRVILRFNEDGTMDESFGNNGEIVLEDMFIQVVNTESDEFMLITYGCEDQKYCYVSKYNYNGEIDMSFGTNGKTALTGIGSNQFKNFYPMSIKVLSDNSIIIAGSDNRGSGVSSAFCKLTEQGNFIPSFADGDGIFVTVAKDPDPSSITSRGQLFTGIIEDDNGNLLFADYWAALNEEEDDLIYSYFVRSFNSNGEPNQNFGENSFYYYSDVRTSGNILLNGNKFLIARNKEIISLNNNGTLDNGFNNAGSFIFENFTVNEMIRQSPGQIIVLGNGERMGELVRLNISGSATSIKPDEIAGSLFIFPNPAKDELRVENGEWRMEDVEILDVSGKKLSTSGMQFSANSVNVSTLPKGIYFIRIKTDKGTVTKKFIKE